jgi:two-component system cell cycle sensor histidine kinase/response regulator CckA
MAIPLRVLVAEDSPDDAELTLLELSRGGFDPVSRRVESAEEMRAALAEGRWDIVLSDNAMPGFGAAAALALCREADPDLPFVVVSGTIGEERAVAMMRAGAGDYFLKGNLIRLAPVVERELREAVNRRARHRADQAASELAAIVESTDDAIISKTLDGVVTSWNHAAERLYGWAAEEAIGRHVSFIVPSDKADELARMMERLRRGERVEHFESGRLRKDGTRIGVSITMSPIRDLLGRLIGISKISRDISGQQRLQRELQNRLRQQEVVAELGRHALLGGDFASLLQDATRKVAETLGTEFCKVLELLPDGRSFLLRTGVGWKAELFGRATVPAGTDSHAGYALLAGGPVVVDDFRTESRFNVLPLLHEMGIVSGVSVIIRGRELSFGILEVHTVRQRSFSLDDVNFLRSVANVLAAAMVNRHANDALGQAQKMEAFGQLAGGVAHDFNNLLTIINGYSEMLIQGLSPGDETRGLLTEILKAGERSATLTQQLLAFSRKQIVAPKILDLNAIVTDTEKMLRRLIGEDVQLATSLAGGLGTVHCDDGQLHQVLLNLAVNARDAMPQGGRLTIETRNVELGEEYCRTHSEVPPGPYVLLMVSDTGCGMTAEVKARLFEPFFTTKEVGKGTGLGLAVIHGVVKQAGGHVEVSSETGVGTTFKVYLPRVGQPAQSGTSAAEVPPQGTETVLMVEDDEGVRLLTRHMLKGFGYTVLEAASGADALRIAGKHAEPVHLVITDVVMPGMSGRQVAAEMASLHPEARVLFVSGYTDDAVVRHGVLQEGVHFLPKPFSSIGLARKIREVLDSPGPDRVCAHS